MKKLITLLIIVLGFNLNAQMVEIVPDSIVDTSDYVESGKYRVYMNDSLISSHTKPLKAAIKSSRLLKLNPNADIAVFAPTGRPTGDFKIYVDQSKLTSNTPSFEGVEYIKTDEDLVSLNFPTDGTDYLIIINQDEKHIVIDDIIYTGKQITFYKDNNSYKILE